MPEKKERRVGLRPFEEILGEMSQGELVRELTVEMAKVAQACEDTGRPGGLTVKFKFKPGPKMIHVAADIKSEIPRPALEATSFFVSDDGSLSVENPRQENLFKGPQPVKNDGEN